MVRQPGTFECNRGKSRFFKKGHRYAQISCLRQCDDCRNAVRSTPACSNWRWNRGIIAVLGVEQRLEPVLRRHAIKPGPVVCAQSG